MRMAKGWMIYSLAVAITLLAGASLPLAAEAQVIEEEKAPSLNSLVEEALEKSAELAALEQRIRAAEASVAPAGALPDPMLSLGVSNVPVGGLDLTETPMSGIDLGASQHVPRGAKRRLRREVREEEAAALQARYQDQRNNVTRRVKQTYYRIQYLDKALEIAEENKALAQDLLATAEARYATGKGLQQDVFRAQVRLSRMVDLLVVLRQGRAAAVTRLNRLLYRPVAQPLVKLASPQLTHLSPESEPLRVRADNENPRLQEARIRARQAETQENLAAEGLRPDFTFGFKYRIRDSVPMDPVRGEDFLSASVAMNLPWLYRRDKVDKEVEAAQAKQNAAQSEVTALSNEVASQIEESVIDIVRGKEQIALLETGLLPQAEGTLASSLAAYATGRVEFLTVLDNQMNLYNLQIERVSLIAEHEQNLAELEYLVSGPLSIDSAAGEADSGVSHDAQ